MCTRVNQTNIRILNNPFSYIQKDGVAVQPQSFYSVDLSKRYKVFATGSQKWIKPSDPYLFVYDYTATDGENAEVFEGEYLERVYYYLNGNTVEIPYFNFYEVAPESPIFALRGSAKDAAAMADVMYSRRRISLSTFTSLYNGNGATVVIEHHGTERTPNKFTIVKVRSNNGLIGTGVAAVHPRDKYNPEAGKRLAMNRAILDLDKKFNG